MVLDYLKQHTEIVSQAKIMLDHTRAPRKDGKLTNLLPGIVFVRLPINKGEIVHKVHSWISNIPHFKGFKNYANRSYGTPIPFSPQRIANLITDRVQFKTPRAKPAKFDIDFKVGDYLLVLRGIFCKYEGELIKIDYNTGILTINTEFFGRLTQIEVNFTDCKKVME